MRREVSILGVERVRHIARALECTGIARLQSKYLTGYMCLTHTYCIYKQIGFGWVDK